MSRTLYVTKCGDVVLVGDDIVEVPVRARKLIFFVFFSWRGVRWIHARRDTLELDGVVWVMLVEVVE